MNIKDYRKIAGDSVFDSIYEKADRLRGKHIVCINSTYQGGGVSEILDSFVVLLNEFGVETGWRILHGNPDFFTTTKKFHNALQGEQINLSNQKKSVFYETNRRFSVYTHIEQDDLILIHDPQPLPLIEFYNKKQPWIFRCHLDLSAPNIEVWNYLKHYILKYDHFVVSLPQYKQNIPTPQTVINPAIDPLTPKNKEASQQEIERYMHKYDIKQNKPIITQISRFDKWKDPLGVMDVFEIVKKKIDCQLVLLGSLATDDPEGQMIFRLVERKASKSRYHKDIKVILSENDFLVNCLQRAASVVVQKSIREGFGLTVSEALFKGTPVVASNVGGISAQIVDGYNGFLHEPMDHQGFSGSIIKLLKDNALNRKLGENGKEYVKEKFLVTRLIVDWLNLFEEIFSKKN